MHEPFLTDEAIGCGHTNAGGGRLREGGREGEDHRF